MNKPTRQLDDHAHYALAERDFPQLIAAIVDADKVCKKLRSLRNKGFANDADVEQARQARDLLVNILVAGNWIGRCD